MSPGGTALAEKARYFGGSIARAAGRLAKPSDVPDVDTIKPGAVPGPNGGAQAPPAQRRARRAVGSRRA